MWNLKCVLAQRFNNGRNWHELVTVEDGALGLVRGILGVWTVDVVFNAK